MNDPREDLIEAAASAWRPDSVSGELRAHPAWHDLDDDGRLHAFELALRLRDLEAALDPDGLSTTAHRVIERIRAAADRR